MPEFLQGLRHPVCIMPGDSKRNAKAGKENKRKKNGLNRGVQSPHIVEGLEVADLISTCIKTESGRKSATTVGSNGEQGNNDSNYTLS